MSQRSRREASQERLADGWRRGMEGEGWRRGMEERDVWERRRTRKRAHLLLNCRREDTERGDKKYTKDTVYFYVKKKLYKITTADL